MQKAKLVTPGNDSVSAGGFRIFLEPLPTCVSRLNDSEPIRAVSLMANIHIEDRWISIYIYISIISVGIQVKTFV